MVVSFLGAAGIDYDRFYDRWKNTPSAELKDMGVRNIMENKMDSASASSPSLPTDTTAT